MHAHPEVWLRFCVSDLENDSLASNVYANTSA